MRKIPKLIKIPLNARKLPSELDIGFVAKFSTAASLMDSNGL